MVKKLTIAMLMLILGGAIADSAVAQDLDEVLGQHYAAMGGTDAWKALHTMEASGTMLIAGGMASGPFTLVQKRPALYRFDLSMQGMEVVQAFDGETVWEINPMMGGTTPREADPAQAEAIMANSDLDGALIGWEEDGHDVSLVGTESMDGTETYKVRVDANGSVTFYYIDAESYLLVGAESSAGGVEATTRLGDYRDIGGLMFPFSIEIENPQFPMEMMFDSIEINGDIDEARFSMSGS